MHTAKANSITIEPPPLTGGTESVYYFHSDHLGSASWITNGTGAAVQHLLYLPFGEHFVNERNTTYDERFSFTGKERDAETGYYYHGARFNSSDIGWLSVDLQFEKMPSTTPYNYCLWNPIILHDPDGEIPWFAIGAVVGAVYRAGVAIYEGKSAREVAGAAVKGAIDGALIASGAGIALSMAGSAFGEAAEQFIGTGSVNLKEVAVSTLTSAVGSGASKEVNKMLVAKVATNATKKIEQKYASAVTQKAIRKEVQTETIRQGKKLGNTTRAQINKIVSRRIQNMKTFDKKNVQAIQCAVEKVLNTSTTVVSSKVANKINQSINE